MTIDDLKIRIDELTCELYAMQDSQKKTQSISYIRQLYKLSEPFYAEFSGTGSGKISLSFTLPPSFGEPFTVRCVLDNEIVIEELCFLDSISKTLKFSADVELIGKNHTIGIMFNNALISEKLILTINAANVKKADGLIHLDYTSDDSESCYLAIYEKNCCLYDKNFVIFESFSGTTKLARVIYTSNTNGDRYLHFFYLDTDDSLRVRLITSATTYKIAEDVTCFSLTKTSRGCAAHYVSKGILYCASITYLNGYYCTSHVCLDLNPFSVKSIHCYEPSALLYVQLKGGGLLYSYTSNAPASITKIASPSARNVMSVYHEDGNAYLYYLSSGKIKAHVYNISQNISSVRDIIDADAYLKISAELAMVIKDGVCYVE